MRPSGKTRSRSTASAARRRRRCKRRSKATCDGLLVLSLCRAVRVPSIIVRSQHVRVRGAAMMFQHAANRFTPPSHRSPSHPRAFPLIHFHEPTMNASTFAFVFGDAALAREEGESARERERARQRATERREGGAQELRGGVRSSHIGDSALQDRTGQCADRPSPHSHRHRDKGTESERVASIPANRLGVTRCLRFRGGMSDI